MYTDILAVKPTLNFGTQLVVGEGLFRELPTVIQPTVLQARICHQLGASPCPLGNRPHANPNGGSLVRNVKHLHFQGINIEDKEPLIDEARWFDDIEASGVAVQSLSAMQSAGASTTPWPYYFATFPLREKISLCPEETTMYSKSHPECILFRRPRRTRAHRHVVKRTRTCARASSRDFARMP